MRVARLLFRSFIVVHRIDRMVCLLTFSLCQPALEIKRIFAAVQAGSFLMLPLTVDFSLLTICTCAFQLAGYCGIYGYIDFEKHYIIVQVQVSEILVQR